MINQQGRFMKKSAICAAALAVVVLAGCDSKQDANEKNFGAAIEQYLDKKGELCLRLQNWPVNITELDAAMQSAGPPGTVKKMAALEAAGLVFGTDTEVGEYRKFKMKSYALTDAGKKLYSEKGGDICYGKKALTKVVKWEGPMKDGDYQEADVKYLYKIDGLADWTKKAEFRTGFPYAAQIIDEAGKKEVRGGVKLTSQGWEPKGLDN